MQFIFLALTLSAAIGFGYGLFRFFRNRSALYIRMIVFGIGCAMQGRLFEALLYLAEGSVQPGFHVGTLGVLGSFLFFFTANYGQMDSLVDDGSGAFRKYRLTALAAPAVVLAMCIPCICRTGFRFVSIVIVIQSNVIALAAYYHLKHLIIPDVEHGVIRCIRPYNLMALFYAFLCMAEQIITLYPVPLPCQIMLYSLLCITLIVFIPVLERGVRKWSA